MCLHRSPFALNTKQVAGGGKETRIRLADICSEKTAALLSALQTDSNGTNTLFVSVDYQKLGSIGSRYNIFV